MKHWFSDKIIENVGWLSGGEKRDAVPGMLKSLANMWKLPSVKRMFISVEERSFRTYVTNAFETVNDCYIE